MYARHDRSPLHIRWRALLPLVLFAVAFVLAGPGQNPGADGLALRSAAAQVLPSTTSWSRRRARPWSPAPASPSTCRSASTPTGRRPRPGACAPAWSTSTACCRALSLGTVLHPHVSVDRLASPSTPPVRVVVRIPLGFPARRRRPSWSSATTPAPPAPSRPTSTPCSAAWSRCSSPSKRWSTPAASSTASTPLPGLRDVAPATRARSPWSAGWPPHHRPHRRAGVRPVPRASTVGLGADDDGLHTEYHHESTAEVDLAAHLDVDGADGAIVADARIDRLPADLTFDLAAGRSNGGTVEFSASQALRPADIGVTLTATPDDGPTTTGRLDVEGPSPRRWWPTGTWPPAATPSPPSTRPTAPPVPSRPTC